jgi:hypothetical protein
MRESPNLVTIVFSSVKTAARKTTEARIRPHALRDQIKIAR